MILVIIDLQPPLDILPGILPGPDYQTTLIATLLTDRPLGWNMLEQDQVHLYLQNSFGLKLCPGDKIAFLPTLGVQCA